MVTVDLRSFHCEARRSKERTGSNLWHPPSTLLLGILCVLALGRGCHRGGCLEAALPLLHVLLRMEEDDVGFGHVEHAKGHRCTQAQGHSQCGRLDVDLSMEEGTRLDLALLSLKPATYRRGGELHQSGERELELRKG